MDVLDRLITDVDSMLRVLAGVATASRPNPAAKVLDGALGDTERRHSAGLMRVNHVGEVCAQALYDSQARFAQTEALKSAYLQG